MRNSPIYTLGLLVLMVTAADIGISASEKLTAKIEGNIINPTRIRVNDSLYGLIYSASCERGIVSFRVVLKNWEGPIQNGKGFKLCSLEAMKTTAENVQGMEKLAELIPLNP